MGENEKLLKLYNSCKEQLHFFINEKKLNEPKLIFLIKKISFKQVTNIVKNASYDTLEIAKIFRYYENEIRENFSKNKKLFNIQFDLYLLLIELFTHLCKLHIQDKDKRVFVEPILETLKESKNLLKLFVPFEQKKLYIINNIIGEQLYTFTHTQYINPNNKTLEYLLELYLHSCEKIFDGFNLSKSSNFGGNKKTNSEIEIIKIKNNLSFLLLTMFHKIRYFFPNENINKEKNFIKIYDYIESANIFNTLCDINNFEEQIVHEFTNSSNLLIRKVFINYYEEKLSLLYLDTDEYKELIDIIIKLK